MLTNRGTGISRMIHGTLRSCESSRSFRVSLRLSVIRHSETGLVHPEEATTWARRTKGVHLDLSAVALFRQIAPLTRRDALGLDQGEDLGMARSDQIPRQALREGTTSQNLTPPLILYKVSVKK